MSSTGAIVESSIGPGRRVPTWAAGLVAGLSRDMPTVLTRDDLAERLVEAAADRTVDSAVHELRRLGWLVGLPVHGVWAFMPPGVSEIIDPYLGLRAWRALCSNDEFMLAGATAAWHLGYLDRDPGVPVSVWLPPSARVPDGLRSHVSIVRIGWAADTNALRPTSKFLIKRRLDLLRWASRLPAFGPDALVAQLATRPSSFLPWADLVAHLGMLVDDCDDERLATLLANQSTAAWQRAAYLLHVGGSPDRGLALLGRRPRAALPKTRFNHSTIDVGEAVWSADYNVVDALVAPLLAVVGKA